ncbi:ankyrin repeat domain-containing protein, chloroplastic-like isoform X2 [Aristolochia californica]|uniref:ankyrin repeat domain-containing protein, chloroplastic-like isoform X2 n=1 Tax=Aristolochia californica TaxID=171875 RepID=UPI0035DA65D7
MPLCLLNSPTQFFPLSLSSFHFSLSPKIPLFSHLSLSNSLPSCSCKLTSFSQAFPQSAQDEEHVIGDCLVFEDGAFEDPFPQAEIHRSSKKPKKPRPVRPEDLIPEEWKEVQAEINMSKKDKRMIAQKLEYGSRIERRKTVRLPDTEEYMSHRATKLSQLKPVVLDKPRELLKETKDDSRGQSEDEEEPAGSSSGRVVPKNPRESETIAKGSLEDISQLFRSDDYEPGDNGRNKSEGPRKLFTKEEKVLLNRRIPNLLVAISSKWFPLHTLAASGEFNLVDKLLKHSVDINAVDKDGLTALHRAILGKKQAIANYLLRESANPFIRDKEGATLMHYAVRAANIQTIKILILYNVDINLPDEVGLHYILLYKPGELMCLGFC